MTNVYKAWGRRLLVFMALALASNTSVVMADVPDAGQLYQYDDPLEKDTDTLDKVVSLSGLATLHASLYTWSYFAWYRGRTQTDGLVIHDEGWFGADTYAGGSDKLGHMYSNYVLHRSTHALLTRGGWDPTWSSVISGGLTMTFFSLIELKDGYHAGYGFSWGDMVFNTLGNIAGASMDLSPSLDRALDFRVEYVPTDIFIEELTKQGAVNSAEDYSGQTFMLAYHLKTLPLANKPSWKFLRYLDLLVGYQTVNYLPEPEDPNAVRDQRIYLGVGLNTQQLFDDAYARHHKPTEGPGVMHHITEYYGLPFTSSLPTTARATELQPGPKLVREGIPPVPR